MRLTGVRCVPISVLLVLMACAPAPSGTPTGAVSPDQAAPPPPTPSKTMIFGVRYELADIVPKIPTGTTSDGMKRLFSASLAYMDGRGAIHPYLAEALPVLGTDSWRVFPDGRMETIYRLRPNLSWHDGHPLTADDFVFALRAYKTPGLIFDPVPQDRLDEVVAPDARTVVFRWTALYPDAGSLRSGMFEPLPRHLLEQPLEQETPEGFNGLSLWSKDYVHAGPYRLERWVPGSQMEGVAFDGHALGRPRIDRVIVKFVPDENTMLTNLLADSVHIAGDNSLRFEHALVLKREWGANGKGTVLIDPIQQRISRFQLRQEYVNPRALLDLRVRRAIAHANDRQAIVDGLFGGEVPISDQALPRSVPYFEELDRAITKYPYDLRRTEQLLGEAGIHRGADGAYLMPSGERFGFEAWVLGGSQNEKQAAIMADSWRRAGFEIKEYVIPVALAQDGQARSTFPGVSHLASPNGEYNQLRAYISSQIPTAANRWRGNNHGGWVNADYERFWDAYNAVLERSERNRQAIEMMRVATDQLPAIFHFHNPAVTAFLAPLQGPALGTPDSLALWNVYEWELR